MPDAIAAVIAVPAGRRSVEQRRELAAYWLKGELESQLAALPAQQFVFAGASDFAPDGSHKPAGKPRPVHVLIRGNINTPGPLASPGFARVRPGVEGAV